MSEFLYYIYLFVLIFASVLAFLVISHNYKKLYNQIFFGMLITLSLWIVSLYFLQKEKHPDASLIFGRMGFLLPAAFILLFFMFIIVFPKRYKIPSKIEIFVFGGILMLNSVLSLSPWIIESVEISERLPVPNYGQFYPIYGISIVISIIYIFYIFIRKLILTSGYERSILKVITYGFSISIFITVGTNLILANILENRISSALAPLNMIPLLLFVLYAILKYRFLDIRVVISRVIYFIIVGGFAYVTFYGLILFYTYVIEGIFTPTAFLLGIFNAIVFTSAYDLLNKYIKKNINPRIVNPQFNPDEETASFNNMISQILNIEEILNISTGFLLKVLDVKNIVLYIISRDEILIRSGKEDLMPKETIQAIYQTLISTDKTEFITDEIELYEDKDFGKFKNEIKTIYSISKANRVKMIAKLKSLNNQSGAFFLIDKDNGILNTTKIKFIHGILDLISLSLGRAFLYKEVQTFNSTLQQKIDQATLELTSKNQQLEEALRKERDMLDILGHELRTPLSTSRNSLDIIDIYKKQGKLDEAKLNHHLDIAKENLTREIKILETILSSSRIDNSRLQLNYEEVDANDVVEDSISSYKEQAEKKGLILKTILPNDRVYCYGDRAATQQIIDNLVSNAIKYTQKGAVTVELKLEAETVVFTVSDTGEGIPAEEIPNLGKKFYRINPYLKSEGKIGGRQIVRPGGTGIGLYVVFKLTGMMNGTVNVSSEVGKGSAFTIKLPRFNPQIHEIKKIVEEQQQPVKAEALVV